MASGPLTRSRSRSFSPAGIRSKLGSLFSSWLILVTFSVGSANAQEDILRAHVAPQSMRSIRLPDPGSEAWRPLYFRSVERRTQYQLRSDDADRPAFRAVSDCAASAMRLALPSDFDLEETPRLAWHWRIEEGLEIRDEKTRAGDDFAARVYVLFEFDAETAGFMARMEHSLGRRLYGVEPPGASINYVWASRAAIGEVWTSPYTDESRLVAVATNSVRAGRQGEWRDTVVDLGQDARRLFSPPLRTRPYALALMVDADNSCQKAIAWFSNFRLLGPEGEESAR